MVTTSCLPVINCTGYFQCSATSCIKKVNPECDGVQDCPNNADEQNCSKVESIKECVC